MDLVSQPDNTSSFWRNHVSFFPITKGSVNARMELDMRSYEGAGRDGSCWTWWRAVLLQTRSRLNITCSWSSFKTSKPTSAINSRPWTFSRTMLFWSEVTVGCETSNHVWRNRHNKSRDGWSSKTISYVHLASCSGRNNFRSTDESANRVGRNLSMLQVAR